MLALAPNVAAAIQEVGRPAAGNLAAEMATAIAQDTGVATVKIMKQQENALATEIRNAVVASTCATRTKESC